MKLKPLNLISKIIFAIPLVSAIDENSTTSSLAATAVQNQATKLMLFGFLVVAIIASIGFLLTRIREAEDSVQIFRFCLVMMIWVFIFIILFLVLSNYIMTNFYP